MNKYTIISLCLLMLGQILAWVQQFGQIKWPWFKDNLWFCATIVAIPTSYAFIYGAKFGYLGLGETWSIRLFQFALGFIVVAVFGYLFLGETLNPKNLISLILAIGIILTQVFFK